MGDKANDREAVRKQLLENTKGRDSVLGKYDIDENGDTTLTDYGLYTIKNGKLTFSKVDQGPGAPSSRTDHRAANGGGPAGPSPSAIGIDCARGTWKPHRSPLKRPEAEDLGGRSGVHLPVRPDRGAPGAAGVLRHPGPVEDGNLTRLGNNLMDGLSNGAIWALVALGYTLVYGIIELINFAHGEIFMLGAFTRSRSGGRSGSPRTPAPPDSWPGCS